MDLDPASSDAAKAVYRGSGTKPAKAFVLACVVGRFAGDRLDAEAVDR
jgi:hypothetical protein